MSTKNCKQKLIQTLKNEGSIKDCLQHFRKFLREKDGNEDETDLKEVGAFELRLQFILDCEKSADRQDLVKKYFSSARGIALSNNSLRKELANQDLDGKSLENKLKEANEDVKQVIFREILY